MNKNFSKLLITSLLLLSCNLIVSAAETHEQPIKIKTSTNAVSNNMVVKDNYVKAKYASAENKFEQSNVKSSYDDFVELINQTSHDDYVFLSYGLKMAEFGFFDLSNALFKKLDTNSFTKYYIEDIKRFYYPSSLVDQRDLIYLADAYSNIVYNNMAIETTSELINTKIVSNSDYRNFIIALGNYKSNNLQQALKYVNRAIMQNNNNVNYMALKAKILADSNKNKQALKVVNEIKKVKFQTKDFQNKINAIDEYVLYKTAKNNTIKDYHLAYYYHLNGKSLLATKVLQASIIQAKQHSSDIFSLLSKIYYENNETQKALELANRAIKEDKHNYIALMTLANISYDNHKYDLAMKYYKNAKRLTNNTEPEIGIAKCYVAINNIDKSKKIYSKMLKKHSSDKNVMMNSLQVFSQKSDYFLPRIAASDIMNNDIWLALANLAIRDNNIAMASTYLNNSFYIDSNNFRYYYYLSLVLRAKGDLEQANESLIKCSRLNSNFTNKLDIGNEEQDEK